MCMPSRGSPSITVRMSADLIRRLQQIALKHKTTVSEIVRMAAEAAAQAFDSVDRSQK